LHKKLLNCVYNTQKNVFIPQQRTKIQKWYIYGLECVIATLAFFSSHETVQLYVKHHMHMYSVHYTQYENA